MLVHVLKEDDDCFHDLSRAYIKLYYYWATTQYLGRPFPKHFSETNIIIHTRICLKER